MTDLYIVTGSSGYIGSTLIDFLKDKNKPVIGIDKVEDKKHTNYLYDLKRIYPVIPTYFECKNISIIHLAAYKDLLESYKEPQKYYDNNINSTLNSLLMANILGCKNFIFASTAAVYGDDLLGEVFEDRSPITGSSPYGKSKVICEKLITEYCKNFGINSFNCRFFNPIGTYNGENIDLSDSMMGNIFKSIRDKTIFEIYGNDYHTKDGTCIRDFIDIRDLIGALYHLSNYDNDIQINTTLNIGTGKELTIKDVCDSCKKILPEFKFKYGNSRENESVGNYANVDKLKFLGYKCKYSIDESISNLFKYL